MMTPEIEPLRIELTHRPHVSVAALETVTDLDGLQRLEDNIRQFLDVVTAYKNYRRAVTYEGDVAEASRRFEDAKIDCPSVIHLA